MTLIPRDGDCVDATPNLATNARIGPTHATPRLFRRLLFGTASGAVGRVVAIATLLYLTPYLIRTLGVEVYGLVMLLNVLTINGYGSLADLGVASSVVKHAAEYRAEGAVDRLRQLLDTSFLLYVGISLAGMLIVVGIGRPLVDHVFRITPALLPLAHSLLVILAVVTGLDVASAWCSAVLEGYQQFSLANGLQLARALLSAGLIVLLVAGGHGARGWLMANAITSVLMLIALFSIVRRMTGWRATSARVNRDMFRRVASFSARIFALRITGVMYNNVDRTVLGIMLPTSALTVYDVANKVHTVGLLPMGFTSSLVVPAASGLHAAGRMDDVRELFVRGTLYTVALSLPVSALLFVLAPEFLGIWIGPSFVRYAPEVRLFLSYLFFWVLPQVGWNMLVGLGRTTALLRINILSVSVNVVLSATLASRWGVSGVIAGTVLGNLIATPLYLALMFREFGITPSEFARRVLLRTFPHAAIAAMGLWVLARIMPPHGLLGLVLYLGLGLAVFMLLFWTGIDDVDRTRLREAIVRRRADNVNLAEAASD